MTCRARERVRDGGREASGLRGNPRTMKATRSIDPQEQGRRRWNRLASGIGGARTVVRGWRVKGRDVLGPVDTAESPESESSGAKIHADEDISSREGSLNGENREARSRVVFVPSAYPPSLRSSRAPLAPRLAVLCSL